jgi:hypothetical protein
MMSVDAATGAVGQKHQHPCHEGRVPAVVHAHQGTEEPHDPQISEIEHERGRAGFHDRRMISVERIRQQSGTSCACGFGSSVLVSEKPEFMCPSVDFDPGYPPLFPLIPVTPSVRRRSSITGQIVSILTHWKNAKVPPSVIESIPVLVIAGASVSKIKSQQRAMQIDGVRAGSAVVASVGVSMTNIEAPSPLVDPLGIGGVNECVRSNAAVSGAERYADGGIIDAHRWLTPSGVTPPDVASIAGVSCVNYTTREGG